MSYFCQSDRKKQTSDAVKILIHTSLAQGSPKHWSIPLLTLVCCMKNTPCVCPDLKKKLEGTDLKANISMFEQSSVFTTD